MIRSARIGNSRLPNRKSLLLDCSGREAFADQTSAVSHAQNLLWAAKKTEYTLMNNPSTPDDEGVIQLNKDAVSNVRQVGIPVSEFSVSGSENEGPCFLMPRPSIIGWLPLPKAGRLSMVLTLRGICNFFKPDDPFVKAKDAVIHEGRYFLVNDPTGIDKKTCPKLLKDSPSGVVVNYNGQVQKVATGQGAQLSAGQYILDPTTNQYYMANQKVNYTDLELQAAIANAQSVATALGNQSQSIAMPVTPSSFDAYSSSPLFCGRYYFARWAHD